MKKILTIMIGLLLLSACSKPEPAANNAKPAENKAANAAPQPAGEPKLSEAKPPAFQSSAADPGEPVKFAFEGFPAVDTSAKAGEYVLVPSYNWLTDAVEKGADKVTFIWYVQKMAQPEKEFSEIQFMSERKKVPNAYIVPIAPGQKAKNGDILLTWWQTGSGMERAIVVDDKDPISPIVRYLDIDYDNPAKSRDNVTTIGKMDEKIVPDSFIVLKKEMEPGTSVACQDGANKKQYQVIRVGGDKIFVKGFAGKSFVVAKKDCTGVPLVPKVKEGDRVSAPFVGTFKDATVSKVDAKIGRVFVKFDGMPDEKAIQFGDVIKK